jgi:NADPH-dependent glutamate synthase beta subunit-like oxidoreductase
MKPFKHVDAKTVKEASELLKDSEGRAKLMAGGTDLLGTLKDKILPDYPETIINIKSIPDMNYIKEDAEGLKIGSLAKLEELARSPVITEKYKIIAEAAGAVAMPQVRRVGTIGGNLCQDVRCWYYRFPHSIGGRIPCYLKGGKSCYALTRENQYHSIFGGMREENSPCSSACPGGVEIPVYLDKIREGDLAGAARTLLNANPMPSITGRVCPHFCEQVCNRGDFDESVSVRDIERFLGDYILENAKEIIKPSKNDTGKTVAIVGSGPAGLTAAYYLRMAGHRVTVFERMEAAGGMLAYVIPAYRLPKDVVQKLVKTLENIGVEFKFNVDIGRDETLTGLKKKFDVVFIGTGAWGPVSIGLDGEESTGFGLEFLTNINRGVKKAPGKKILVIGGGNAAIDVAISSLRLGAEQATLACLESLEEMPALPWEIEQAIEEGVKLMTSWGPNKVLKSDGKVTGMELVKCTSVFNEQGRFAPVLDKSVTEIVAADSIMMSVGYSTELGFIDAGSSLKVERGLITVDGETQDTRVPGIFAGGSITHGPATVIEAIAAGKRASDAIDVYLKGKDAGSKDMIAEASALLKFNSDNLKATDRVKMPKVPVPERRIEIEDALGLGLKDIEGEANRCFNCGCVSVNPSDMAVVLMALGAGVKIAGPKGNRTIPVSDFFNSIRNALEEGEMVTEIQVPRPQQGAKQTFIKFRLRESIDFPVVSIASVIKTDGGTCKDASIVLGAVAPVPIRATKVEQLIKGKSLNQDTVEAAARAAVEGAIPLKMNAYKVEIARTLVKRALSS